MVEDVVRHLRSLSSDIDGVIEIIYHHRFKSREQLQIHAQRAQYPLIKNIAEIIKGSLL